MEISQILTAAKAAFETAAAHRDALMQAAAELRAKAARGAVRLPEIDAEINQLRGLTLEDDAVAGVAGAVRLSVKDRAEAERKIAGLRTERAELVEGAEGADAGVQALQERINAAISAVSSAAKVFVKEKRHFDAALGSSLQSDLARMTLPDLFRKWPAIPHHGISSQLDRLSIAAYGVGGRYLDREGGWVKWKTSWRADQALVALHDEYNAALVLESRCIAIVDRAEQQRRNEAETARLAEQQARLRGYQRASVSHFSQTTPQTPSEREARRPPVQVIGPYLGEAS